MTLFLVRHGRPLIDPTLTPAEWPLDPAYAEDVLALRASGRLPDDARWFCSPEPKALATARLLTDAEITVVDDLREHVRETRDWIEDFEATVERAFAEPEVAAYDGWDPLAGTHERVVRAAIPLIADAGGRDVVMVGHGTAWTLLAAAVTGAAPDLGAWRRLRMPDLWMLGTDEVGHWTGHV